MTAIFALLGSALVKAARKMLIKFTPEGDRHPKVVDGEAADETSDPSANAEVGRPEDALHGRGRGKGRVRPGAKLTKIGDSFNNGWTINCILQMV